MPITARSLSWPWLVIILLLIHNVISVLFKDHVPNNIDCYFQTFTKRNSHSNSSRGNSKLNICKSGFYRLPEFFTDEEAQYDQKTESSYSDTMEGVFCCPVGKLGDERWDGQVMLWPNERKLTWSRAFMTCHTLEIPGLESIRYLLYTKKQAGIFDYEELSMEAPSSILRSKFIRHAPVKIVIHGFMSSPFIGPAPALRAAYSTVPERINLIAVQWEALANLATAGDGICYDIASQGTKFVGRKTANLIEYLVQQNLTTLDKVHILGHSLGSHCAGFTGKYLKIGKLSRITGFDPARPNFDTKGPLERLDPSDAEFVDVIHTATRQWKLLGAITGGVLPFPVGLRAALGHKDFYPNKGTHQPGCIMQMRKLPVLCSHSRSYAYYADSITYRDDRVFIADECKSISQAETGFCPVRQTTYQNHTQEEEDIMGEYTTRNNSTRKIYLVKTNARSPFPRDYITKL